MTTDLAPTEAIAYLTHVMEMRAKAQRLRERADRIDTYADVLRDKVAADLRARAVRPYCLRCEVPIYLDDESVWRREATASQVCPRNPAVDGHEPDARWVPWSPPVEATEVGA